jgi:hypothetical protein
MFILGANVEQRKNRYCGWKEQRWVLVVKFRSIDWKENILIQENPSITIEIGSKLTLKLLKLANAHSQTFHFRTTHLSNYHGSSALIW